jgi:hypothetical protein
MLPDADPFERTQARDGFVDAPPAIVPIERSRPDECSLDALLDYDPIERAQAWESFLDDLCSAKCQYIASLEPALRVQLRQRYLAVFRDAAPDRARKLQEAVGDTLRSAEHM